MTALRASAISRISRDRRAIPSVLREYAGRATNGFYAGTGLAKPGAARASGSENMRHARRLRHQRHRDRPRRHLEIRERAGSGLRKRAQRGRTGADQHGHGMALEPKPGAPPPSAPAAPVL